MARMLLVRPEDMVAVNAVQADPGYVAPVGLWAIASDTAAIGDILDPVSGEFMRALVPVETRRELRVAEVEAMKTRIQRLGAPYLGKRIDMDDASRANLSGLALTAALVEMGALSEWPASYAQGWICMDNTRIVLAQPAEGIALAATVAGWYSALIQFARDAKDVILVAADPDAAFAAIDWAPWTGA